MNFTKFFATKAMVLGFGAALLFAGPARAQEVSNQEFTMAYNQQAAPIQDAAATTNTTAPAVNTQEAETASESALVPLNGWAVAMLLLCMGICVYIVPKTGRDAEVMVNLDERKNRRWVGSPANGFNAAEGL